MEPERVASLEREIRELRRRVAQKDAEIDRLRLNRLFLETIFDGIQEEIMVVDRQYGIRDANRVFLERYRLSKEAVLGRKCHEITYGSQHPCEFGDRVCPLKQAVETGTRAHVTHVVTTGDKRHQEILRVMYPLASPAGDIDYLMEISRDMTEQRRLEKALLQSERLAAVGKIVAHVAHEIKNPLMIIGGFTQQVKKGLRDDKAAQKLDMALAEVRRLERLVAQLGDVTKEHALVKRPVDVNRIIRDVLGMLAQTGSGDMVRFVEDLSVDLGEVECDPDKIKQVFINLIVNGIEAMKEGGTLRVITRSTSGRVEIAISDEGEGISEMEMDRIFEPFYTTREKGSGLGLPISFRIVKAHEGEIFAESRPGRGTTFVVRLPGNLG